MLSVCVCSYEWFRSPDSGHITSPLYEYNKHNIKLQTKQFDKESRNQLMNHNRTEQTSLAPLHMIV